MKKIAIITARSGSKGLKNKNMLFLINKPILFYTIEAAIKSKCFDEIILSTDSIEYIKNCQKYFNITYLKRDKKLATDKATSYEVISNILNNHKTISKNDIFCLLQPTSPLRNEKHIKDCFKHYKKNFLVSVSKFEKSSSLIFKNKDNKLDININLSTYRRQDQLQEFIPNGAIYISKVSDYLKYKTFFVKNKTNFFIMDKWSSIDVDTIDDFNIALWYLRNKQNKLDLNCYDYLFNKTKFNESILLGDSLSFNFKNLNFKNLGIPGISSSEYLDLLKRNNVHIRCKNLYIWLGTNDLIKDKKIKLLENIKEIIKYFNFNNFYIIEIPFTLYRNDRNNNDIYKLNYNLKNNFKKNYININNYLSKNNQLLLENTIDGLHLSENAYKIILKEIQKYE